MEKTWIVVAGRTKARIFESLRRTVEPQEIFEIPNPEGFLKEQELISDRPGRATHNRNGQRNPLPRRHSAVEQVLDYFVAKVVRSLVAFQLEGRFDNLILVAEPRMLGKLRAEIATYNNLHVRAEVSSDLIKTPKRELSEKLKECVFSY